MNNLLTRRAFMATLGGFAISLAYVPAAYAFSVDKAEALIDKVITDIFRIINSGKPEAVALREFEGIFSQYADTDIIGRLVLGADGRTASAAQKRAFASAFQGYISRKYGRRFRELAGGGIEITDAQAIKNRFEVTTITIRPGRRPLEVIYVVSGRSGLFFDMRIAGISLIKSERSEIGTMLDRRGGDLNRLIADLKQM